MTHARSHAVRRRPGWLPLLLTFASGAGLACARAQRSEVAVTERATARVAAAAQDIHSYARPAEARVTDVALDLAVEFPARRLAGTATLTLDVAPDAQTVVLDTKDLAIKAVTSPDGAVLPYEVGPRDSILGSPLTVQLPSGGRKVVVTYETSPDAGALQWLDPAQTAGKKHPYLFSQGQAILTRTWIPTQDSPGIRQTYSGRIVVPAGLRAVMSAQMMTPEGRPADGGRRAFEFRMDKPIPAYLIALAVGDIAFRPIGERTGVYAEPSVVDAAAKEFADVDEMMQAAESLYGPYRWGRYDILVLPPSFPFGGMENPRLTFATPTILAGDRSLVSLVAHELAHSWSGNLVTNATWRDFWLNEGFTTYFENRIMERLRGPEYAAMLRQLGRTTLRETIEGFGDETWRSVLYIDLAGKDPDEGSSEVPYEKGAAFLRLLERTVWRERFDAYLRSYFDRHAFKTMTTQAFVEDLRRHLFDGDEAALQRLRIEEWLYQPGLPSNAPVETSTAFEAVAVQARAFAGGAPAASLTTQGWSTHEWLHFLEQLPDTLPEARLAELDRTFGFTGTGNSEIQFAWLRTAIRNRYEPAMPALERFLTRQGRRKFVRPLYQELVKTEWGRAFARRVYEEARPLYHPVTASTVDEIVR